jgi:MFS family permease
MWRRPGVFAGCWAGATSGAWRGLLGSYVPVALIEAGLGATPVGVLVAVANGSSVAGSAIAGRTTRSSVARAYFACTLVAGIALGATGFLAGVWWLLGVALSLSGIAAGVLLTLGPALAADTVHPEERGDAIAVTGLFRAGALFVAPLGMAAMVLALPLAPALGIAGLTIALPAVAARGLRAHPALSGD